MTENEADLLALLRELDARNPGGSGLGPWWSRDVVPRRVHRCRKYVVAGELGFQAARARPEGVEVEALGDVVGGSV
ncbi:hypothetical protein C7C46_01870 [Streptomyces tateyamensis]|uniref:Uncharacterized protein n=1 Tax=Streptomyces tateyamensis TaxID=565073 RepID=A0A2V4NN55_9ACTN|nr:hypothetical protein [Streptomyces tateyamensis]PYC88041.1 hypothetical protein C7C46_01870 [Streptomyces tateyamensis]